MDIESSPEDTPRVQWDIVGISAYRLAMTFGFSRLIFNSEWKWTSGGVAHSIDEKDPIQDRKYAGAKLIVQKFTQVPNRRPIGT